MRRMLVQAGLIWLSAWLLMLAVDPITGGAVTVSYPDAVLMACVVTLIVKLDIGETN